MRCSTQTANESYRSFGTIRTKTTTLPTAGSSDPRSRNTYLRCLAQPAMQPPTNRCHTFGRNCKRSSPTARANRNTNVLDMFYPIPPRTHLHSSRTKPSHTQSSLHPHTNTLHAQTRKYSSNMHIQRLRYLLSLWAQHKEQIQQTTQIIIFND